MKKRLLELANVIGWVIVQEEDGLVSLEYTQRVNEYEAMKHLFKLGDVESNEEFLDAMGSIIEVLPKKLKKKIFKLTKQSDFEKKDDLLDLITFTIEEFKVQSEFTKLDEYAQVLGVDLKKLGYFYSYEITKKQRNEILAKIESYLPIEMLPQVGKIKKTEYKIGFVRTKNPKIIEQEKNS
ncbi:MAG: hypothetical protein J5689_03255 [Clostridia bacterium]|nr:hypothetical protein [Clostridia bacterium]